MYWACALTPPAASRLQMLFCTSFFYLIFWGYAPYPRAMHFKSQDIPCRHGRFSAHAAAFDLAVHLADEANLTAARRVASPVTAAFHLASFLTRRKAPRTTDPAVSKHKLVRAAAWPLETSSAGRRAPVPPRTPTWPSAGG